MDSNRERGSAAALRRSIASALELAGSSAVARPGNESVEVRDGERAAIWPVAIWDNERGAWTEADRKQWPSGTTEHVIVECEPALGVLNVGTIVLAYHALEELHAATEGDFGEDPRPAWLVIGIRSELSRSAKRKAEARERVKGIIEGSPIDGELEAFGKNAACSRKHKRCSECIGCDVTWQDYPVARDCRPCQCSR